MSSIDNRIVQMEFDNKRFESNARETMSTLDKLKEKLNFGNSAKGLEEFQNAANTFNLSHIANAIDEIGNKFTFMGQLGFQAMERIASAALNAGTALVKSISIDQISAGMSKYEQETNVIQTLYGALKPKGTKLDEIYEVMETLTAYSDETSYSYTQMADAVSKFVNAGVDLHKAETVIEGISNAAALAGIGIHDTEIIYRNFADAIGKGGFRAQDWKSIKIAHMDTEWLKEAFIQEAIAQGKLDKSGRVQTKAEKRNKKGKVTSAAEYKNVRDDFESTLVKGWLDNDVINGVMLKYATRDLEGFGKEAFAAAQNAKTFTDVIDAVKDSVSTGWSRSFRIIFGDLEEAIAFFTPMANKVIEFTASIDEARNQMLGMWKDLGGRDSMISTLDEIWRAFTKISDAFSKGFVRAFNNSFYPTWKSVMDSAVFGKGTANNHMGEQFFNLTKQIEESAKALNDWLNGYDKATGKVGVQPIHYITSALTGLFSVVNMVRMAIGGVFTFVGKVFEQLMPTVNELLSLFSYIGFDLSMLNRDMSRSNGITEFAKNLAAALEPLTSRLPKIVQLLRKAYDNFKNFWKNNKKFVAFRKSVMNVLNSFIKFIPKAIESIIAFSKQIIDMVKGSDEWKALERNYTKYVKPVLSMLGGAAINFNNALAGFFSTDTSDEKTMWGKLKKRFSAFNKLGPMLNGMWTALKKQIPWLQNVEDWWNSDPFIAGMKEWISAIGAAIDAFFSEDTSGETSLIGKLKMRFEAMWESFGPWLEGKWKEYKEKWPILQQIEDFLKPLFGWGDVAKDAASEGEQNSNQTISLLEQIWNSVVEFVGKIDFGKLALFGLAIGVLVDVYKKARSLFGWASVGENIADAIGEVGDFIKQARKSMKKSNMMANVSAILEVAASIWLLGDTLQKVSKLSWEEIGKGLTAMGGLFVEEGAFMVLMTKFNTGAGKAKPLQMIGLAVSMLILGKALKDVSSLSWEEIGKGLTAMGGLFAEEGAFMVLVNHFGSTSLFSKKGASATGMIALAISMRTLGNILKDVSSLTWDEIGRGLTTMGGLFAESGAFAILVNRFGSVSILSKKGTSASSLIATANSMKILADVLKDLAAMTWDEIGRGLTTMGGLFLEQGAFMILVNRLGSGGPFSKGLSAAGVISSAGSIVILANKLQELTSLSWEEIAKGLSTMAGLFVEEGAFMVIIGFLSKKNLIKPDAVNATTGILAGGIGMMGDAMAKLGKLSWEEILRGAVSLAAIELVLGVFVGLMGKFKTVKVSQGIGMAAVAGAIWILVQAFMPLTTISWDQLGVGIVSLVAVMAVLGLFCGVMSKMKMSIKTVLGVIVSAIALAALMVAFAFALTLIKDVDVSLILAFGAAMVLVSGAMAILASTLNTFGTMSLGTAVKATAIMVIAAAGLGAAVAIIIGLVSQAIEDFSSTIAIVGANLALYSEMVEDIDMEKVNDSIIMLKDMAIAFVEIGSKSYGSLEEFKDNLSHMGASIRLFYLTTEQVDLDRMKAIQTSLVDISGAFVTIGASEYGENLTSFRSNLIGMGSGLKLFQLSTAEVDIEQAKAITGALKEIATSLTGFPEVADVGTSIAHIGGAIKLYSESLSGVTLDTVPDSTSIKAVFDALNGAIPNDENLANAAAFATDDKGTQMTNFAIGLTNIATAVSTFSKNAEGLAFGDINKAIYALTALNKLNTTISTTVVSSYGSFSVEVHNQVTTGNLTTLATDMTTVATAVSDFSDSVKDSNFDQIDKAIAALTAINKLNTELGTTTVVKIGSFSLELSEQKASMSTFSEDIILLGTALKDFGTNMSGVDLDKMDAGIAALGKIVELNNALPPTGGLKEMLVGSQDLTKFSANLKLLGAGTKAFSEAIAGENFNPDNIAAAGTALIKIAEVNAALPETGGISSWFTGDESLSGFAGSLKVLGEGIANFVKSYGNTKITDDVIAGINLLSRIANIQVKLGNATAWYSLATFGNEFSAMAESAVKANETLANMYLSWEDPTELIALVDGLANIQVKLGNIQFRKSLADLGNDMKLMFQNIYSFTQDSTWFSTTDTDRLQKVTDAISAILDSLGVFEGEASPLIQKGEEIIAMLAQGIGDDVSIASADSAVIRINNQIISTVKSYEQSFINVGTWIPAGLSKGIWDNRYAAINAAIEVMNAAIDAAEQTAGIASPSKAFADIGMYSDMGLAQGFSDYIYLVDSAASEVTNSALNTVLQDMKAIQELPLDDMAIEPTIRPVLDMSNVAAGASSIDGLLGGSRSIGVDTRQLEASARLIDNSSGSDIGVISQQIIGLQEQIAQLEEAMTHFKMVMDTGALVGAIEADMDKALGERMRNGERGR